MTRRIFYDTEFIEKDGRIQLISIGMVDEVGKAYYAVSSDFDIRDADKWVRENVLDRLELSVSSWKPLEEIRKDLYEYLRPTHEPKVELWGWFCGYDHVALMSIFGRMIAAPGCLPYNTFDVAQLMHHKGIDRETFERPHNPKEHNALYDAIWTKELYERVMAT